MARANAFLDGRDFATPADVKHVAHPVLRHRVVPTSPAGSPLVTPSETKSNCAIGSAQPLLPS
ncbi:MAG: hypothetical protein ACC619_05125 [Paracoccaceae bacterium]